MKHCSVGGGVMIRAVKHHEASVLANDYKIWTKVNKCRRKHTLSGPLVDLGVQKYQCGVSVWHLRSHHSLLLDSVGLRWASSHLECKFLQKKKKKRAGAELRREFGNCFSHIFKISSSAKRENTVWKLTSDGGPESGGSESIPIQSWWNTILLTTQFQ